MRRFKITVENQVYDVMVEEMDTLTSAPSSKGGSVASAPVSSIGSDGGSPIVESVTASSPAVPGTNFVPSPLSGTIVEVHVSEGQQVDQGDKLVTLEAMKMNTVVSAPLIGNVSSIKVRANEAVQEGQVLLILS